MRIKIELESDNFIKLKKGFLKDLQGLIYSLFDTISGIWLHENGFKYEKRSFKLFTYSSLLEKAKYVRSKNLFVFPNKVSFIISSPVDWILEQISLNSIKSSELYIGRNKVRLSSVSVFNGFEVNNSNIKIITLTPIEVHSTFESNNGKKTYFYTPFEPAFSKLVNENLKKKWSAYYKKECPYDIDIKPLFKGDKHKRVIYFGRGREEYIVNAWSGIFELTGDPELLKFAYYTGIGSRNSQGFGMFNLLKEKKV